MTECQNCQSFVTPRFARVAGDNDDTVHACPRCVTSRELTDGAAANLGE